MCLYIEKETKRLKAEQDIVVYKVLIRYRKENVDDWFQTLYQKAHVFLGKTYKSKLFKTNRYGMLYVEYGLHTFINIPDFTRFMDFKNKERSLCVVKCIIPKGSFYYKGKFLDDVSDDSYASNKLTYVKIVSNPILYPSWVISLKWSMLAIGILGFIYAAVLASKPQSTHVKVCIYEQKFK